MAARKKRITVSFEDEQAFWDFVTKPGSLKLDQVEVEQPPQPAVTRRRKRRAKPGG